MTGDSQSKPDASAHEFRVAREQDRLRLDQFLAQRMPEHSRAFLQRCIREGRVTRNGGYARQAEKLATNDVVCFDPPDDVSPRLEPEPVPFGILAEDEHMLVIHKPPGVVVHPAKGNMTGTLVHGLLFHDAAAFGEMAEDDETRPGIVHRLDKDTSGAMVVARNWEARRALKAAFKARRVEKTYLTILVGEFGRVVGRIENQIGRHPRHRQRMAVVPEGGKRAATRYRVLQSTEDFTLMQVRIETGRTHQIRVHFSHLRHPVYGDRLYGGRRADGPGKPKRQMLHAWKLAFPHPVTGVMREYMAPLPRDFREVMEAIGFAPIGREEEAETTDGDPPASTPALWPEDPE